MSAYQGYYFSYDGVASQKYGLKIVLLDSMSLYYEGGSSMEITKDKTARANRYELLGSNPNDVLTFELTVATDDSQTPINEVLARRIKTWLFGSLGYKKLVIFSEYYHNVYFNCILNNPQDIVINGNTGWKFTVECDSGGAWEQKRSKTYNITTPQTITFNNISGDNDYLYPNISFTTTSTIQTNGSTVNIINHTANDYTSTFTELLPNETITIDGETKVITSNLTTLRSSNFNKNFVRFIRGTNVLECTGDISTLTIEWENFKRLGG